MKITDKYLGYEADFQQLNKTFDFSSLKGQSVCITGATGMIGRCLLSFLQFLNTQGYKIEITAAVRSASGLGFDEDIRVIEGKIEDFDQLDHPARKYDYIFHAANPANPTLYVEDPVGTMNAIIDGTKAVLEYARQSSETKLLYLSTVEVVGSDSPAGDEALGVIDIDQVRSSYPQAKRTAELFCRAYFSQYGCRVAVARPSKVYGLYNHPKDSRIIAHMQRCATSGQSIVLRSWAEDKFSLSYAPDTVSALLLIALKDDFKGDIYTIADPDSFQSVSYIAQKIAMASGVELRYDIDEGNKKFAKNANNKCFEAVKLKSLGWQPLTGIDNGIDKVVLRAKYDRDAKSTTRDL